MFYLLFTRLDYKIYNSNDRLLQPCNLRPSIVSESESKTIILDY
jgi:hypothetical protein